MSLAFLEERDGAIVEAENNATAIDAVETNEDVVKFFENGQLLIKRDGIIYDVMGRVVR